MNKFYDHIWGVSNFKVNKTISTDNRVNVDKINFMGIKFPQANSNKIHFTNVIILILRALIKLVVIVSNLLILAFKNHTF